MPRGTPINTAKTDWDCGKFDMFQQKCKNFCVIGLRYIAKSSFLRLLCIVKILLTQCGNQTAFGYQSYQKQNLASTTGIVEWFSFVTSLMASKMVCSGFSAAKSALMETSNRLCFILDTSQLICFTIPSNWRESGSIIKGCPPLYWRILSMHLRMGHFFGSGDRPFNHNIFHLDIFGRRPNSVLPNEVCYIIICRIFQNIFRSIILRRHCRLAWYISNQQLWLLRSYRVWRIQLFFQLGLQLYQFILWNRCV